MLHVSRQPTRLLKGFGKKIEENPQPHTVKKQQQQQGKLCGHELDYG